MALPRVSAYSAAIRAAANVPVEQPEKPGRIASALNRTGHELSRDTYFMANLARPLFGAGRARVINPLWVQPDERITFHDLVGKLSYFKRRPWQKFAVGTALDIGLSPSTWLTGGATKIGKGAKFAAKAAEGVTDVNMIRKLAEGASAAAPWYARQAKKLPGNVEAWISAGAKPLGETVGERVLRGQAGAALFGRQIPGTAGATAKVADVLGAGAGAARNWLFPKGVGLYTGNPKVNAAIDEHWGELIKRGAINSGQADEWHQAFSQLDEAQRAQLATALPKRLADAPGEARVLQQVSVGGADVQKTLGFPLPEKEIVLSTTLDPAVLALKRQWDVATESMGLPELAAKVLEPGQYALHGGQYEIGVLTKEGRKLFDMLSDAEKRGLPGAGDLGRFAETRIRELGHDIPAYNKWLTKQLEANPQVAALVGHKPGMIFQAMEENPAMRLATRGQVSARALARVRLENSLADLAVKSDDAKLSGLFPENYAFPAKHTMREVLDTIDASPTSTTALRTQLLNRYPDHALVKLGGKLEIVPKEAKMVLDRLDAVRRDPGMVKQGIEKVTQLWKPWMLATPRYFLRNIVNDSVKNIIADAGNPAGYVKAMRAYLMKKPVQVASLVGEQIDDIVQIASRNNVLGGLTEAAMGEATKGKIPVLSKAGRGIRFLNEKRENTFRLAHFINRIEAGDTIADAAKSVNTYLFDYKRSSPAMEELYRVAMPFGRWYVRNVPNEVANILTKPGKYAAGAKLAIDIEKSLGGTPPDQQFLAPYLQDELGMRVRERPDGKYDYFQLGRWLPVGDLIRLIPWGSKGLWGNLKGAVAKASSEVAQQMGGPYKTAIEAAMNYSTFTGKEIEKYPGQLGYFAGALPLRRRVGHVLEVPPIKMGTSYMRERKKGGSVARALGGAVAGTGMYTYDPKRGKEIEVNKLKRLLSSLRSDLREAQSPNELYGALATGKIERRMAEVEADLAKLQGGP